MHESDPRRWRDHVTGLLTSHVRVHAVALAAFTIITVALTYPVAFQMDSTLRDEGDPLFNTWVIAWNAHSLITGNLNGLFDTNIFFPTPNTAAYSEFLIPQSLAAVPILLASANPILAYNVVLLVAIITSAFGAYLLGAYFNGPVAGFVAGLIFAFNPFMVSHLSHIQLLSAGGIPLAFLCLHKFLDQGRTKHLLLFSLFYVLQALASTAYALYLTLFAGLYILLHVVRQRRFLDTRFWRHMALHASIALLALGPFFFQYLVLRRDFGLMIRRTDSVATAASFLSTPSLNRLYGETTAAVTTDETALFPGLCALLLAAAAVFSGFAQRRRQFRHTGPPYVALIYRTINWGLVLFGTVIIYVLATGGIDITLWSIPLRATSLRNPMMWSLALILVRLGLKWRYAIDSSTTGTYDMRLPYVGIVTLALFLTIPVGVSTLFHNHMPGFDGIRGVTRIHIMTMLGVAILATYGLTALSTRLGHRRGTLTAIVALVIGIEYVSVPVPVVAVPLKRDVPAVYRWLASQEDDFAFAEYPIIRELQLWQLYFSTHHWKRLVTGASAFASPTFIALRQRRENVPSPATLRDFETIGVRYLIVHEWPSEDIDSTQIQAEVDRLSDRLRLAATFDSYDVTDTAGESRIVIPGGRARVYELTRSEWRSPRVIRGVPTRVGVELPAPDRDAWSLSSSPYPDMAHYAADGNLWTWWHTDEQQAGDFLQLDLGREMLLDGVVLGVPGNQLRDTPRGYRVDTSTDGHTWSTVAEDSAYQLPLTEFLRPLHLRKADIPFPAVKARHIRIVQTGSDPTYWWSVSEINVTSPPAVEPDATSSTADMTILEPAPVRGRAFSGTRVPDVAEP